MTREQLEHLIRVSASITGDDEIIVIGSQAVLGQFPHAPAELLVSNEADLFPKNFPEMADLIDGTIGELSPFHRTFGYYGQGVAESTAVLPSGWKDRLVPVRGPGTRGATGWCLEIHDLVLSKYAAGRPKDLEFIRALASHRLASADELGRRLGSMPLPDEDKKRIRTGIVRDFGDC